MFENLVLNNFIVEDFVGKLDFYVFSSLFFFTFILLVLLSIRNEY